MPEQPYLVIWRELHGRHTVDVLHDFVEEVIPASDQAAFVLVVDQVQFICIPHFPYLSGTRKRPLQINT